MSDVDGATTGQAESRNVERVPEYWPPADPIEPVAARRIHWLLAVPLAIPAVLFPKRAGPHAAASGWTAAYAVHIFWLLTAWGTVVTFSMDYGMVANDAELSASGIFLVNPLSEVRRAWAVIVLSMFTIMNTWIDVTIAAGIVLTIEAAFWAAGVLIVPFIAAGEGPRRSYLRAVKLLLWASAFPAIVAWAYPRIVVYLRMYGEPWFIGGLALFGLWQFLIVLRLGMRYSGPNIGPRWRNREPRCEACGYSIVFLPTNGRCPECGKPIGESLPARRRLPAFAAAGSLWGAFLGFLRTTLAATRARRFSEDASIWRGHRQARRYALTVCTGIGVLSGFTYIAARIAAGMPESRPYWYNSIPPWMRGLEILPETWIAVICGFGVALAWVIVMGLFVSRFGFRDMGNRVTSLFYSTAWLFVPTILGVAGGWTVYAIEVTWRPRGSFYIKYFGSISYEALIWTVCLFPAIVALVLSFLQLRAMLRATRYANA